jgi:phosphoribosylaminoimidazole-succinocarboxamide synthase
MRIVKMNTKRTRIYEGKAKILYEGPEPGTIIVHYKDDTTAFDATKKAVIDGKGVLNNRISELIFQRLNDLGMPTHFLKRLNMREQLVREVEIIPLEVVVRNVAAGSLAKRLGLEEGSALPRSIIEFYYKNDQLHDPMVSEEHITAFNWASPQEIDDIMHMAIRINDFLSGLFRTTWSASCSPTRSARIAAACGTLRPRTNSTRTASAATWAGSWKPIRKSPAASVSSSSPNSPSVRAPSSSRRTER